MASTTVPYTPFATVDASGGGGTAMGVHATPEDMGAAVGGALQHAGAVGEQVGNQAMELAIKRQGMVNETLSAGAESQYLGELGKLNGEFRAKTGLEASTALPQYTTAAQSLREKYRDQLPAGAARGFDMLAIRHEGNTIGDWNGYAASQEKQAHRDSGLSLVKIAQDAPLNPDVAHNPDRIGQALGDAKFGVQMQMDDTAPGLSKDPESGELSFDDKTPEGAHYKAHYQAQVDNAHGAIWENAINTVANTDPLKASAMFTDNKASIPVAAQFKIAAALNPKVQNVYAQGAADQAMTDAAVAHKEYISNPDNVKATNAIAWTMQHEGGFVTNDGGKGPTNFGINQEANPDIDVAKMSSVEAAKVMKDRYWDAIGADKMDSKLGAVAFDTAVNMGVGKAKALVAQADGDPQKLIDLRRAEYQRLADNNPERYGKYLNAWNSRLDDLQKNINSDGDSGSSNSPAIRTLSGMVPQEYAKNADGTPVTLADYLTSHRQETFDKWDKWAEQQAPGDSTFRNMVRERVNQQMSQIISDQTMRYKQDNQTVMKAISGEMSNGKVPTTWNELYSIPGMKDVLERVPTQDTKFYDSIPTIMARMSARNQVTNSPNAYETIQRVLEPDDMDHPNKIGSQDHLDKLLGRTDGNGINIKDYQDAKKSLEGSAQWRNFLATQMKTIVNANGNIDGKGQQRAVDFYNNAVKTKELNDAKGDAAASEAELIDPDSKNYVGAKVAATHMPSTMSQISELAKKMLIPGYSQSIKNAPAAPAATTVRVTSPDGKTGMIPVAQLGEAIKSGYKKAE